MNLVLEEERFFRDYLRLRVAETAHKEAPNIFQAATLQDALSILREERIDAVLSDAALPPDSGQGMEHVCEWAKSSTALYEACQAQEVPCVLLTVDPALLAAARALGQAAYSKRYQTHAAVEQLVVLASAHLMARAR